MARIAGSNDAGGGATSIAIIATTAAAAAVLYAIRMLRSGSDEGQEIVPVAAASAVVDSLSFIRERGTPGGTLEGTPGEGESPSAAMDDQEETAELLEEQLSRNTQFLGPEGQEKVASASVAVVGVGGVGSHAATILARTGVRHLRLIDPSVVTERSLRSHALAGRSDIGMGKAEVTARELKRTVPASRIDARQSRLERATADELLDSIDVAVLCFPSSPSDDANEPAGSLPSSCLLAAAVAACEQRSIKCVPVLYADASVAGAREVSHQRLSGLHDVCGCVQARQLAARLRTLVANAPLLPCASTLVIHAGEHACPRLQVLPPQRPEGSMATTTMTAAPTLPTARACEAVLAGMGHAAAAAVLTDLAGVPLTPMAGLCSKANREDWLKQVHRRERDTFGGSSKVDLWPEDIEYLVMDVWGGRCALSGGSFGGGPSLVLTRWDRTRPASVGNLILLAKDRAEAHDKADTPMDELQPTLRRCIERALERAARERAAWARRATPATAATGPP
jgi:hypothetical protein